MAVLESIRKRTWLLITVVAGALILFVVQAALDGDRNGNGAVVDSAGEIGGVEVSNQEYNTIFEDRMNQQRQYFAQQRQQMPQYIENSVKSQAWEDLVRKYGYKPTFEESGLMVTADEQKDMVHGVTIDPSVTSQFLGPDGKFSKDTLQKQLEGIADDVTGEGRKRWGSFLTYLKDSRFEAKYKNVISKTNYVTTAEAKNKHFMDNSKVDFDYVFIPFASMPDSTSGLEVSEEEKKIYLEDHKNEFQIKSGRVVKYLSFDVKPSSADSARALKRSSDVALSFKKTANDTSFFKTKSDKKTSPRVVYLDKLPSDLKLDSAYLKKGFVKGPVLTYNGYEIDKVIGTSNNEWAQTAHVLIKYGEDSAKAKATALEVLAKAKSGSDFGKLALEFSEDEGSSKNKGEYPLTKKGSGWVKPFEDAVFNADKVGVISKLVETQFGYHIMNILQTKTIREEAIMVKITKEIRPSKATIQKVYTEASTFIDGISDTEELEAKVNEDDTKTLRESDLLTRSSTFLNGAGANASSVISWAYNTETEVGDVSKVIPVGTGTQYVVASLLRVTDKNNIQVADVNDVLTTLVRIEKKGKLLKNLLESTEGDLNVRCNKINEENGPGYARFNNVKNHVYANNNVRGAGKEPSMVGTAISIEKDTFSKTLIGEAGVYIVRTLSKNEAGEIADYSGVKESIKKAKESENINGLLNTAIKDYLKVEDNRF